MKWPGTIIMQGSTDKDAVIAIKQRLNALLSAGLDVNNINFGPSTKEWVQKFQKNNRLLQDGKVGELTWERLFTVIIPHAIESDDICVRAEQIAFTQLFVRELTNKNDGKEVEAYLKSVGLGKGYPWCMAFVFWCFLKASEELSRTNPVPKTAGVLDCHARNKKNKKAVLVPANQVRRGDQGIMDFGEGKGHTFIVTSAKNNRVFTVEGNTSADPAYAGLDREGNGVFERSRPLNAAIAYWRYE